MKINKNNKKGTEKILSIYWFAILVIIAGAVVAMVSIFYGSPYDIREIEANIMINKVSDCLSENGKLNQELFFNDGFNEEFSILSNCEITFETELAGEEQYYVEINFYELDSEESIFMTSTEFSNFKADCEIAKGEKEYKRLVKCVDRDFYSVDDLNNVYKINVLSIVRKTQKNVK